MRTIWWSLLILVLAFILGMPASVRAERYLVFTKYPETMEVEGDHNSITPLYWMLLFYYQGAAEPWGASSGTYDEMIAEKAKCEAEKNLTVRSDWHHDIDQWTVDFYNKNYHTIKGPVAMLPGKVEKSASGKPVVKAEYREVLDWRNDYQKRIMDAVDETRKYGDRSVEDYARQLKAAMERLDALNERLNLTDTYGAKATSQIPPDIQQLWEDTMRLAREALAARNETPAWFRVAWMNNPQWYWYYNVKDCNCLFNHGVEFNRYRSDNTIPLAFYLYNTSDKPQLYIIKIFSHNDDTFRRYEIVKLGPKELSRVFRMIVKDGRYDIAVINWDPDKPLPNLDALTFTQVRTFDNFNVKMFPL